MKFIQSLLIGGLLTFPSISNAKEVGGISLGTTRVIYPINSKQVPLNLSNRGSKDRYLVNAWVENEAEEKSKDLLITPPIFISQPKSENTFRIVKIKQDLPTDRETVYWINVKSIPSINKEELEKSNVLQLAVLTRIKLFIRPDNLAYSSELATKHIRFFNSNQGLMIENNSPYFLNLTQIKIDDADSPNMMISPLSKQILSTKKGNTISFQSINDYGGLNEVSKHTISNE